TVPRSNSIGHASLPGCSTMAWPPSWKAPSSKLVRVRMDGLKNTSAIERPLSSLPSLLRLNAAASASSASRSGRLQSWVLRKCLRDIDRSLAVVAGGPAWGDALAGKSPLRMKPLPCQKRKNPAWGWVLERTARHSGHPAEKWDSGRRAREVIPEAIRAALAACG